MKREAIKPRCQLLCDKPIHWELYGDVIKKDDIVVVYDFAKSTTHEGFRVEKNNTLYFIPFDDNWQSNWIFLRKPSKKEN